jgi:hypothetical protein
MTRSIRWRLAASYMLIALVAAAAMGGLALSLVHQSAAAREERQLLRSAAAVAHQVEPLVTAGRRDRLAPLVGAASFVGNARVRVVSPDRSVLADSGSPGATDRVLWLSRGAADAFGEPFALAPGAGFGEPLNLGPATVSGAGAAGFEEAPRSPAEQPAFDTSAADVARSDTLVRVPIGPASAPAGFVELSEAPDTASEAVRSARRALALAGAAAVALAGLLGLVVGRAAGGAFDDGRPVRGG